MLRITFLLVLLTYQLAAQTVIFPFGSSWKYLDNGSDQGTAWRAASFSDGTWKTGNGKFGYGIPDAATIVSYGPNASNKYITTYFRKAITIPDASAFASYTGNIKRDDGVVVYVNGAEVYRNNMPTGTITYRTLASASSGSDDGATPIPFNILGTAFTSGTNVIAVEIHQFSVTSSDIAFDLTVAGNVGTSPDQQYTLQVGTSGSGTVSKNPNQSTYTAGSTVSLTATPAMGYQFSGWSGDASGTANPLAVTMNSNKNITATFTPVSAQQQVLSFTLINAANEQDLFTLQHGATINLASLPSTKLNIRANTSPATVGSVMFELSGTQSRTYSDNAAPYALHGDDGNGNYYYGNWNPPATGTYTLKATPYTGSKATGTAGIPLTITFTFAGSGESPPDQVPPTVLSVNRQNPTTEITTATSVTFRATFSEQVKGVDAADFMATTVSGTVKGTVASVITIGTGGTTYDVIVSSISGTGVIRLDLKPSGTGITDMAGNAISGGYASGQTYTIEQSSTPTSDIPINFGSPWKYLDNGTDQGTTWRAVSFNDGSWKSGYGKFGYGIKDAATVVSFGPDPNNKYITTYFRKTISIPSASAYTYYAANIKRDDGVIVYVNGVEVYRNNMPSGTTSYNTLASASSGSDDGVTPIPFNIPGTAFTSGTNVIAVEIHQVSVTSSDIAFDLELLGKTGPQPILLTRGPYLQVGSKSAITLRWRTDIASDSKIEVGTTLGTYTLSATNTTKTTEHEVRLGGLTANTKYFYRIGSSSQMLQSGSSNYFTTAPPDNTTRKIRVAVFGDSGKDSNGNRTGSLNSYLNFTGSNPGELFLLLGDNALPDGTDEDFQREFFTPFGDNILKNHVVFPAPGNHEYDSIPRTARDVGGYYKSFSVPTAGESGGVASGSKAYYSFDWGNIHFISLDSYGIEPVDNTKLYDTLGAQVKWLKKDLEVNTKKWIIVYLHHPPYTMGSHNSDTESDLIKIRQNLLPILERHGVDLVLSGHSHNYERSYLLNNYYGNEASFSFATHTKSSSSAKYDGSTNSCAYITASGTKRHGIVYVVAGSGGNSGVVQAEFPHNALPFAVNDGGMLYLEIEDNRLDGKMLRKDGTVFDKFTIMQDVNRTIIKSVVPGESVQLTASWVGDYKWSTGETTRSITVSPSKSASYRVTDNYNCLADVFNINVTLASATSVLHGHNSQLSTETQADSFKIYPTLARRGSIITVKTNSLETNEAIVTDITGRILYTSSFTAGTAHIETAKLSRGMYFISTFGNKQLRKYKFMISD